MLVVAGFWHILKLAAGYYLLLTVLAPNSGKSDQLLLLWFGSPAMMAAAFFFFPWFKSDRYSACIGPARLTLGFDAAAAVGLFIYIVLSNIFSHGGLLQDMDEMRIATLCLIALALDALLLWQIPAIENESTGVA